LELQIEAIRQVRGQSTSQVPDVDVSLVLVELPKTGQVRMIGNLLGDPHQEVIIGTPVEVVFEHHLDANPPYTLAHWRVVASS
jgi:uncharacterized OB-fold protein